MAHGDFVLRDGQTVVMAGDSITSVGRNEAQPLGNGYVRMIAALSAARRPERRITFHNSGVGGDTVVDLAARWDSDVLALRPDWLSVSIGVNDVWHQFKDPPGGVHLDHFAAVYRELLETTRSRFGGCGLVLMTPGLIKEEPDGPENRMLRDYIDVVKSLATKFDAFCVDIHQAMLGALAAGSAPLTRDGVHPLDNGHALMALTWLETLNW